MDDPSSELGGQGPTDIVVEHDVHIGTVHQLADASRHVTAHDRPGVLDHVNEAIPAVPAAHRLGHTGPVGQAGELLQELPVLARGPTTS